MTIRMNLFIFIFVNTRFFTSLYTYNASGYLMVVYYDRVDQPNQLGLSELVQVVDVVASCDYAIHSIRVNPSSVISCVDSNVDVDVVNVELQ